MKTITNLITSIILASWVSAIAILSIQNITLVSLKFLNWETIQIPFGVVLAFSFGVGAIAAAIAPLFLQLSGRRREQYEEDY
ncbi:MAG: lipopolysaccharide assembly protein LapA domain-containing protein [Potamolinea sp.]